MRSCSRLIAFAAQADDASRVQPHEQTTSQLAGLAITRSPRGQGPEKRSSVHPEELTPERLAYGLRFVKRSSLGEGEGRVWRLVPHKVQYFPLLVGATRGSTRLRVLEAMPAQC